MLDQYWRYAEIASDRLAYLQTVKGPGQVIGDGVCDGPVQLIAFIVRCNEIISIYNRAKDIMDPFRRNGY
jgi:hypothetical protein